LLGAIVSLLSIFSVSVERKKVDKEAESFSFPNVVSQLIDHAEPARGLVLVKM